MVYIANCSLQHQRVWCRFTSSTASQPITLSPSEQREIETPHEAEFVESLRRHGACTPVEADREIAAFSGLLYRIGSRITDREMRDARIVTPANVNAIPVDALDKLVISA